MANIAFFLAIQIAVFLARCETVLARHFLLTFQEEHEIWWENLIMNQINVCNALTVAYSMTVFFKVFISKEICCISIYYFVIFNKVVDVIEQKPQLRRPEAIFPKLVQNTWQMGTNHSTKFMKEMKKPLLFGVGCPGQKEKRLFSSCRWCNNFSLITITASARTPFARVV